LTILPFGWMSRWISSTQGGYDRREPRSSAAGKTQRRGMVRSRRGTGEWCRSGGVGEVEQRVAGEVAATGLRQAAAGDRRREVNGGGAVH
ncbi:hypothetical protein DVA69_18435, partial [Acinetobacter baumannii]